MVDNASIVDELRDEHGVLSAVLPCPCCCDANSDLGKPVENCPYCYGGGRIQYGIDEVDFS